VPRTCELKRYSGAALGLLTGRVRAYGFWQVERFLSQVARAGGEETFTDAPLRLDLPALACPEFRTRQPAASLLRGWTPQARVHRKANPTRAYWWHRKDSGVSCPRAFAR